MSSKNFNRYRKLNRSSNNKKSKLCCFGSLDYLIIASALAIAISEEVSDTDLSILSTFFAVLADELALIESLNDCNSGNDNNDNDNEVFIAPIADAAGVAMTRSSKKIIKKKKKKRVRKIKKIV